MTSTRLTVLTTLFLAGIPVTALARAPWLGYTDQSSALQTAQYDFGILNGGNENYYDGDFADYDGDRLPDRALLSRYGLLHNQGNGVLMPVASQVAGLPPCSRAPLIGYEFDDCTSIGNDAVQWADIDGDGDPDSLQGGNGEAFVIQTNRAGRFSIKSRRSGASALNIALTDLERDGDVDLVLAHVFCSNRDCTGPVDFTLLVNNGTGVFTDETDLRGLPFQSERIAGVASGDLDGDGDFDLVLLNGLRNELTVAINDGLGFFSTQSAALGRGAANIIAFGGGFNQHLSLGDIDADGDLDVVSVMEWNADADLPIARPVGTHPNVSHVLWINDGSAGFGEESASRFDVGPSFTGVLAGGNGKLVDYDYDGDLDLIAYHKAGPVFLQVYDNDGTGRYTWRPDLVLGFTFLDAGKLGTDTDVTDLDGDGTYDLWIGLGNQKVHTLINTHRDATGLPADLPRDPRIDAVSSTDVTLSWKAPSFAAVNRYYRVYRSEAARMGDIDRRLVKTVSLSPHEDDSFAAPITRLTTSLPDPDVVLDGAAGRLAWTDRTVVPGVRYHYTIAHVGTERTESRPTAELVVDVPPPAPGPADTTAPVLDLLSPTDQQWSAYPRVVLAFADGESAVDPSSLRVSFDVPVGVLPAGTDLSASFQRRDGNSYVYALPETLSLPAGLATLTVSVADNAGNVASRGVTFNVSVLSAQLPAAVPSVTLRPGTSVVDFDASASNDADGEVLRWEWYFGDGEMALGQTVSHLYRTAATFDATLVVRDNDGGVATASSRVSVPSVAVDSDGDGVNDSVDCAPLDPGSRAPVAEVTRLYAVKTGPAVTLTWDDQAPQSGSSTVYDLLSGSISNLRTLGFDAAASCLESDVTRATTAASPLAPSGDGSFFGVRARNACGSGTFGTGSSPPACP